MVSGGSEAEGAAAAPPAEPPPRADRGGRALAALLGCALVFAAVVMILAAVDIDDTPLRSELQLSDVPVGGSVEYYDGSSTEKRVTTIAYFTSGALAAVAALFAFAIAISGRLNPLLWPATGLAIAVGVAGMLVNNV
jgi:hypothetical protein